MFSILPINAQEKDDWKQVRDSRGIKAYTMKLSSAGLKKVRVETITNSSLSAFVSLVRDAPRSKDWVYANVYASTLHQDGIYDWVYYGQSDAPWPVNDRDVITRVHFSQNSSTKEVTIESVADPDYLPLDDDFVRIPMTFAVWNFKPLGNGKVLVSFELLIDLGGAIPMWLVNLAATKGPYNSLESFIELVHEKPYCDTILDYVVEPGW